METDRKKTYGFEATAYFAAPMVIPGDSGFFSQWHLQNLIYPGIDLNVTDVWNDYQGNGVVVGVIDTGIDYNHSDLNPNYRFDLDYDAHSGDNDSYASSADDIHGTPVAGVIGATFGNGNVVGVAPGADITGFRIRLGSETEGQILTQMQNIANVDVANNSWGYNGFFKDNFLTDPTFASIGNAIRDAVDNGRGGLGTIITFSAGNSRTEGQNVNYHNFQSSQYTITTAALDQNGGISYFSTPGAAILVAAPGTGIYTTDVTGSGGYNAGDYVFMSGTSFSSPAVAGVAALMLEANPQLGYRDVQEILAYSSKNPTSSTSGWQTNGAFNWNGGGLTVSHDYGYGLVDAHAAVRLAETWIRQSTFDTLDSISLTATPNAGIYDHSTTSSSLTIANGLNIDHVEVELHLDHTWIGDLAISLTSPDQTTSVLTETRYDPQIDLDAVLTSTQFWGETGEGTWTLSISDNGTLDQGILSSWTLSLYGDQIDNNDVYIYTDEWARHGSESGRQTLSDSAGTDTLNFAAVTTGLSIDLTPGSTNNFFGYGFTIEGSTTIENVFGGDAGDSISGTTRPIILQACAAMTSFPAAAATTSWSVALAAIP